MPCTNLLFQLKQVNKTYPTGEDPFVALNNVSLDIFSGEFLGITGKSGAGKTTLLNMISGVSQVTSGEVFYFNYSEGNPGQVFPIHNQSEDQLARWRGKHLGIVYQSFELMPTLSLVENVLLPPDFLGDYHPIDSKIKALELLDLVEIADHAYKIPAHISGGQKQRVAIARALVNNPEIIIVDEPTGNLDSITAEKIIKIFEKLVKNGKTVVMVTHDESLGPRFSRQLHIFDGVVSDLEKSPVKITKQISTRHKKSIISVQEQSLITDGIRLAQTRFSPSRAKSDQLQKNHPAIVLHEVDKVYANTAGKFVALKSVNMQLDYGQFISIVGKSGCGKSTLINMISGIDHPTAGEIKVGNQHIYQMSESERALWRGKNMGVVFQFFQLLPTLSLLENTMLPMDFCKVYPFHQRSKRAMELLEMVGLEDHAHKLPTAVSSGQQQSAAVARALATDPPIILADEPTGNLDSKSAETILCLFEDLANQGKTVLIVTHDPSITKRTDQTIILSDGEIIDQTIARALPYLSHPQMLDATRYAEKKFYQANEMILKQSVPVDYFFMIISGEVEIVSSLDQQSDTIVTRLGQGQFFGEIGLTSGKNSIAGVRATYQGTEIALLPKQIFYNLIDDSPLTRNIIQEVAASRLVENQNRRLADR